ncbi:MAG: Hsp20/alpha crystallin family protein [Candidatus Thorarchaeota archaeon]
MARKKRFFDDFWNFDLNEIFRSFDEEMESLGNSNLAEYQSGEPITFGYSVRVGPDTNYQPEVRQWGNLNDFRKKQGLPEFQVPLDRFLNRPLPIGAVESSNRYVDFIEEGGFLRIIMEVPGYSKDDLSIDIDEMGAEITVSSLNDQKLKQVINLPVKIDPSSTKTTLKNGILEIIGKKSGASSNNKIKIQID